MHMTDTDSVVHWLTGMCHNSQLLKRERDWECLRPAARRAQVGRQRQEQPVPPCPPVERSVVKHHSLQSWWHHCQSHTNNNKQWVVTLQLQTLTRNKTFPLPRLETEETMASGGRRKSSILVNRKLSTDFARKLSAISVASDISLISDRFGLDQGELKNIVSDILEMNLSDDFDVSVTL